MDVVVIGGGDEVEVVNDGGGPEWKSLFTICMWVFCNIKPVTLLSLYIRCSSCASPKWLLCSTDGEAHLLLRHQFVFTCCFFDDFLTFIENQYCEANMPSSPNIYAQIKLKRHPSLLWFFYFDTYNHESNSYFNFWLANMFDP